MNQKELLIVSITVFLTIVAWIFADLYHVANTNKVVVQDRRYLKEINILIDKKLLDTLQTKK